MSNMSNLLKISEAASMALHAMVFMAREPESRLSTREIATLLNGSEAHMSKVLQRLSKAGLVKSVRGPKGGFILGKDSNEITLLDVYEAIEGPLVLKDCVLGTPICSGEACIFGGLIRKTNGEIKEYLSGTRIAELTDVYRSVRRRDDYEEENNRDR